MKKEFIKKRFVEISYIYLVVFSALLGYGVASAMSDYRLSWFAVFIGLLAAGLIVIGYLLLPLLVLYILNKFISEKFNFFNLSQFFRNRKYIYIVIFITSFFLTYLIYY